MTLKDEIINLYHAEVLRTGSYLLARHQVMWFFKLSAGQADRILGDRR